jgi:hypothetical protein
MSVNASANYAAADYVRLIQQQIAVSIAASIAITGVYACRQEVFIAHAST